MQTITLNNLPHCKTAPIQGGQIIVHEGSEITTIEVGTKCGWRLVQSTNSGSKLVFPSRFALVFNREREKQDLNKINPGYLKKREYKKRFKEKKEKKNGKVLCVK